VLSALWLVPVAWLASRGHDDPTASPLNDVYFAITLCFWIGHRFSSTYVAYFTSAYRPLLRTQRTRFVWVPLAILLVVFAVLLPPDDALPFSRAERVVGLVILDVILVNWHFASQHYGMLSLYRLKAGQPRGTAARRLDKAFALGAGGALVLVAEIVAGTVAYQDRWIDRMVPADAVHAAAGAVRSGATWLVTAWTGFMLLLEARSASPSFPRAAYLVGMALMVLAAFHVDPFLFLVLWTGQHWTSAIGISTRVASGDPPPGRSPWYRGWHAVNRRPLALAGVLVLVSVLFLPVMEVEAVDAGTDERYGPRVFPQRFLDALDGPSLAPALVALGLATAFLHYALDRAVFRFSDPEIRRAARGLLE
jgi:hypothetical protein